MGPTSVPTGQGWKTKTTPPHQSPVRFQLMPHPYNVVMATFLPYAARYHHSATIQAAFKEPSIQTERIAKRTTTNDDGITFTFRDDSQLTYNANDQTTKTTRPQPTHNDVIAAREYIMAAIANRRQATA